MRAQTDDQVAALASGQCPGCQAKGRLVGSVHGIRSRKLICGNCHSEFITYLLNPGEPHELIVSARKA